MTDISTKVSSVSAAKAASGPFAPGWVATKFTAGWPSAGAASRATSARAKFSCNAYTLGGSVASREATLTVAQPNTPPTFACGPNQAVNEDRKSVV